MFCNQCEQTARGTGCVDKGVCGKDADVQSLQETLLYGLKGMCAYAHHARRLGMVDEDVDEFGDCFSKLTVRELDVCAAIKKGLSSKEIADQLGLSVNTVHKHRQTIRRKLFLNNKEVNLAAFLRFR